jgi:hypothetical protein
MINAGCYFKLRNLCYKRSSGFWLKAIMEAGGDTDNALQRLQQAVEEARRLHAGKLVGTGPNQTGTNLDQVREAW